MTKNIDTKPIIEEDNIISDENSPIKNISNKPIGEDIISIKVEEAPYNTVSFVYSSINLNPIIHNHLAKYRQIETCHLDYRGKTAFMHLQDDWEKLRVAGVFSQYIDRESTQPNIRMTVNLYAYVLGNNKVVDNFLELHPKFKEKLKPTERIEALIFDYSVYEGMETWSNDEFKFIDWIPTKETYKKIPKVSCFAQYVVNLGTYKEGTNNIIDEFIKYNPEKMAANFYKNSGYYGE